MAFPLAIAKRPHARPDPGGLRLRGLRRHSAPHPRIVALGGGTGLPAVLRGLVNGLSPADADTLTAVVTVTDDGGSSGRLREQFGVLPPGDIRNCLVALASDASPAAQFLQHRFASTLDEAGHPVGNLLLTALTQVTGDFSEAIAQVGGLIGARGRVLPATLENVRLRAQMDSGEVVTGETAIVDRPARISRLSLLPSPKPDPEVLRAIVRADAIVVGPGSLFTSVLPNLMVEGIAATISAVKAVRIYVANLMTQPGETDDFTLDDHLRTIREHVGFDLFDFILVNRGPVSADLARRYASQGSHPVPVGSLTHAGRATVVECDLAAAEADGKIRHDSARLGCAIRRLIASRYGTRSHDRRSLLASPTAAIGRGQAGAAR
jgi:uncharacterized cofD-like protein